MCLAMAFSSGVPVVVVREFPSMWPWRKTTEDVFFLADQECPGLEVFPLIICVLYKVHPTVSILKKLAAAHLFHTGAQPM